MKRLLIISAICLASAYCHSEAEEDMNTFEALKRQESFPCVDGKAEVEEAPGVTYFRIIADSGETLLDINSNTTSMIPFYEILMIETLKPENGHWAFANNTPHYITKIQTKAGEVRRFAGKVGVQLFRGKDDVYSSENKSDVSCVRLHGFSLTIDPGFQIKRYDGYRMTALLWSSLFGLSDVARNLIERGADVNQGSDNSGTPIMAAVLANQPELVELMIQRGADVVQYEDNISTLHVAAFAGSTDVARILIDHGVKVNNYDISLNVTPLHFAAVSGQCGTIELLISKGADVNSLAPRNTTAFQIAIGIGHLDCGHKLIAAGADVNFRNGDGNTALILALLRQKNGSKSVETIDRFLREFNPDVNILNKNGESALSIANKKNLTEVAELLKSRGAV